MSVAAAEMTLRLVWTFSLVCSVFGSRTVTTPDGTLRGFASQASPWVTKFLGVPYANPVVRFEEATLVSPWNGEVDSDVVWGRFVMN